MIYPLKDAKTRASSCSKGAKRGEFTSSSFSAFVSEKNIFITYQYQALNIIITQLEKQYEINMTFCNSIEVIQVICLFECRYNIIACSLQRPKRQDKASPTHPNTEKATDLPIYHTLKDFPTNDSTAMIVKDPKM